MTIPNDYSRCNGFACDKRGDCERFVCPGTGPVYTHDAITGCVGFIDIAKPLKQSVESANKSV